MKKGGVFSVVFVIFICSLFVLNSVFVLGAAPSANPVTNPTPPPIKFKIERDTTLERIIDTGDQLIERPEKDYDYAYLEEFDKIGCYVDMPQWMKDDGRFSVSYVSIKNDNNVIINTNLIPSPKDSKLYLANQKDFYSDVNLVEVFGFVRKIRCVAAFRPPVGSDIPIESRPIVLIPRNEKDKKFYDTLGKPLFFIPDSEWEKAIQYLPIITAPQDIAGKECLDIGDAKSDSGTLFTLGTEKCSYPLIVYNDQKLRKENEVSSPALSTPVIRNSDPSLIESSVEDFTRSLYTPSKIRVLEGSEYLSGMKVLDNKRLFVDQSDVNRLIRKVWSTWGVVILVNKNDPKGAIKAVEISTILDSAPIIIADSGYDWGRMIQDKLVISVVGDGGSRASLDNPNLVDMGYEGSSEKIKPVDTYAGTVNPFFWKGITGNVDDFILNYKNPDGVVFTNPDDFDESYCSVGEWSCKNSLAASLLAISNKWTVSFVSLEEPWKSFSSVVQVKQESKDSINSIVQKEINSAPTKAVLDKVKTEVKEYSDYFKFVKGKYPVKALVLSSPSAVPGKIIAATNCLSCKNDYSLFFDVFLNYIFDFDGNNEPDIKYDRVYSGSIHSVFSYVDKILFSLYPDCPKNLIGDSAISTDKTKMPSYIQFLSGMVLHEGRNVRTGWGVFDFSLALPDVLGVREAVIGYVNTFGYGVFKKPMDFEFFMQTQPETKIRGIKDNMVSCYVRHPWEYSSSSSDPITDEVTSYTSNFILERKDQNLAVAYYYVLMNKIRYGVLSAYEGIAGIDSLINRDSCLSTPDIGSVPYLNQFFAQDISETIKSMKSNCPKPGTENTYKDLVSKTTMAFINRYLVGTTVVKASDIFEASVADVDAYVGGTGIPYGLKTNWYDSVVKEKDNGPIRWYGVYEINKPLADEAYADRGDAFITGLNERIDKVKKNRDNLVIIDKGLIENAWSIPAMYPWVKGGKFVELYPSAGTLQVFDFADSVLLQSVVDEQTALSLQKKDLVFDSSDPGSVKLRVLEEKVRGAFNAQLQANRDSLEKYIFDAENVVGCIHGSNGGKTPADWEALYVSCKENVTKLMGQSPSVPYFGERREAKMMRDAAGVPIPKPISGSVDRQLYINEQAADSFMSAIQSEYGLLKTINLKDMGSEAINSFVINTALTIGTMGLSNINIGVRTTRGILVSPSISGSGKAVAVFRLAATLGPDAYFAWSAYSNARSSCDEIISSKWDVGLKINPNEKTVYIGPTVISDYTACHEAIGMAAISVLPLVPAIIAKSKVSTINNFIKNYPTNPVAVKVKTVIESARVEVRAVSDGDEVLAIRARANSIQAAKELSVEGRLVKRTVITRYRGQTNKEINVIAISMDDFARLTDDEINSVFTYTSLDGKYKYAKAVFFDNGRKPMLYIFQQLPEGLNTLGRSLLDAPHHMDMDIQILIDNGIIHSTDLASLCPTGLGADAWSNVFDRLNGGVEGSIPFRNSPNRRVLGFEFQRDIATGKITGQMRSWFSGYRQFKYPDKYPVYRKSFFEAIQKVDDAFGPGTFSSTEISNKILNYALDEPVIVTVP